MAKYPKICIVGLKCYDLLTGAETPRYIGGIESQLVILARGLVARGFPVSFVTYDHDQPDGIEHDGIQIHKAFASDEGIPIIRFLHPRWTGLCSALDRADADIYYQMGAGCETGQVALWCKRKRKHFVFATASDSSCVPDLPSLKSHRDKYLYRYGLKNAKIVISQTHTQQRLLQTHYGVLSILIRIFTPQPRNGVAVLRRFGTGERWRISWIGRICPEKRPHLLLDVSRALPEYVFDVIGDANADTEYAQKFRSKAKNYPSIILHGKISHELLEKMYAETALLVGTSHSEGFPVTFIEAWSCGIPVVSTFDPDGVIDKYNLGWTASSVDELVDCLKVATGSSEKWRAASETAGSYYVKNHTVDAAVAKFEQLFLDIVG